MVRANEPWRLIVHSRGRWRPPSDGRLRARYRGQLGAGGCLSWLRLLALTVLSVGSDRAVADRVAPPVGGVGPSPQRSGAIQGHARPRRYARTTFRSALRRATAPTARPRRWDRVGAGLGIVFVALQLGLGAVLGGAPALDAPAAEIQSYLVDDGSDVLVAATMGTLSAFFFILFLGAVRTFLRTARCPGEPEHGRLRRRTRNHHGSDNGWPADGRAGMGRHRCARRSRACASGWNLNTLALVPIGSSGGRSASPPRSSSCGPG